MWYTAASNATMVKGYVMERQERQRNRVICARQSWSPNCYDRRDRRLWLLEEQAVAQRDQ